MNPVPTVEMSSADFVLRISNAHLSWRDAPMPFAFERQREIDAHWRERQAQNPKFFDGRVLMLQHFTLTPDGLTGEARTVRFRDFLAWREVFEFGSELGATPTRHLFAGALIRDDQGRVLAVRAAAGTINDRMLHLPGGFVDETDVAAANPESGGTMTVDLAGQIYRELEEELSLSPDELVAEAGFIVVCCRREIGILRPFRATSAAIDRLASFATTATAEAKAENSAIVWVTPGVTSAEPSVSSTEADPHAPYFRLVMDALAQGL